MDSSYNYKLKSVQTFTEATIECQCGNNVTVRENKYAMCYQCGLWYKFNINMNVFITDTVPSNQADIVWDRE